MPWTKKDYPASMKNLPKDVRNKAIEIANALLEGRDMDEGIAIATATSRAKDWAANRGKDTENKGGRPTDVKEHGEDRYVIPLEGSGWGIKTEGNKNPDRRFDKKENAVKLARAEAREANASLTIQKRTGKVQKRISYNPNRKAKKQK
jgi:uncharacterized protein YdaT